MYKFNALVIAVDFNKEQRTSYNVQVVVRTVRYRLTGRNLNTNCLELKVFNIRMIKHSDERSEQENILEHARWGKNLKLTLNLT